MPDETTVPFRLKLRPWPVRFWRHYRAWRQRLGVLASLRAAWSISNVR